MPVRLRCITPDETDVSSSSKAFDGWAHKENNIAAHNSELIRLVFFMILHSLFVLYFINTGYYYFYCT